MYINRRKAISQDALNLFLTAILSAPECDIPFGILSVIESTNIAIAISGGGYRAMLTGAGILSALDSRTTIVGSGNDSRLLSGILQASNYIGGVSGGSWLVMSNIINDFKSMEQLKSNEFQRISKRLLPGIPDFDPGFKGNQCEPQSLADKQENSNSFINIITRYFKMLTGAPQTVSERDKGIFNGLFNVKSESDMYAESEITPGDQTVTTTGTKVLPQKIVDFKEIFSFYKLIHSDTSSKKKANCSISLTDYWGRALHQRLFESHTHRTFSSVMELSSFKSSQQPFPILLSIQKTPDTNRLSINSSKNTSPLIELTPVEFGSCDSHINGFLDLKYLGSEFEAGIPVNRNVCRENYDDIGFLTATSSSLFNKVFLRIYEYLVDVQQETKSAIHTILKTFGLSPDNTDPSVPQSHPDYAIISPNPFYKYSQAHPLVAESKTLYLADGGDEGENIGFDPFLQPRRKIDIILAYDMSSDIYNFPNGTTLIRSASRYHREADHQVPYFEVDGVTKAVFPLVPSIFETMKLKERPIFLGCDLIYDYPTILVNVNTTKGESSETILPPLIVYTANRAITFPSNTSTFKLSYTQSEINGMMQNGYNVATISNSSDFATCVACAILKRHFDRVNMDQGTKFSKISIPESCGSCYREYCWHPIRLVKSSSLSPRFVPEPFLVK